MCSALRQRGLRVPAAAIAAQPMWLGSPPPDRRPVWRAAHDRALPLDAMGRLDANSPDAAGIDGEVVVERRRGEVAVHAAEIAEIRAATGQWILPSMGR